jgi:bacillithiol biosynthesis cysteine-adding enzyme BshC
MFASDTLCSGCKENSLALMKTQCIPHSRLPGTTALFADYLSDFERLKGFYRHNSNDPQSIRDAAAQADIPLERRRAVVSAMRRINGDSPSLDLLAQPGTVAIVSGQQVGLFGGPCYTLYKALTAIKLARQLTDQGIPAVPIFWLATEDHDLAETDHCWLFGLDRRPRRVSARVKGLTGQPVGSLVLDSVPLDELKATLDGLPYADDVVERVVAAYQPGRTMGEAFRALLSDLLGDRGLLFFDPLDPQIREIAAPFLLNAFERSDELSQAILARDAELKSAGYHSQVLVEPQSSLFLHLENGRRVALRRHDGAYFHDAHRYAPGELEADPAALSPNALLRPVMQDYLLPTAAYIGGPAEVAYFAQSEVLYSRLLGRMPVAVPRSGFTLLDERAYAMLNRFDLTLLDCLQPEENVRERIAAKLLPANLQRVFDEAGTAVLQSTEHLCATLDAFDPTLGAAMRKSAIKMQYQLDKNRSKAAREALRREKRATENAAKLSGLLYPERHLQERLYSFLPLLAWQGMDLIETLYENTYRSCPDHLLMTL